MKRGLAGLASVGAVLWWGRLRLRRPWRIRVSREAEAAMGKTLTLHTGGNWAGYMPSFQDLSHECADDLDSLPVPVGRRDRRPIRCPAFPPARSSRPPGSRSRT